MAANGKFLDPARTGRASEKLQDDLDRLIIGQTEAIRQVVGMYQTWAAGLNAPGRPIGNFLFLGPTGVGKAQPLDAGVLTATGWRRMGDIKIGDRLRTPANTTTTVVGVYPQGEKQIYRVTFADGRSTECCGDHLWRIFNRYNWGGQYRILPLHEIDTYLRSHSTSSGRLSVQLPEPVDITQDAGTALPMPPYALGALLGNGALSSRCSVGFSDDDPDTVENLAIAVNSMYGARPVSVHQCPSHQGTHDYGVSTGLPIDKCRYNINKVTAALRELGLHGPGHVSTAKFVPQIYKDASIGDRISLLQGLLDTDGTVAGNSISISFSSSSKQLADDVQYIVRSLGGCAGIKSKIPRYTHKGEKRTGALAYRVWIRFKDPTTLFRSRHHLGLFRSRHHLGRMRVHGAYQYADCLRLRIMSIEPTRIAPAQCIAVDDPAHLYITDDFVVTHNTRMVEATAESLIGEARAVLKIDCAEFQHSHEIAKLIGSPPGYLGHRETHPVLSQEALNQYFTDKVKLSFVLFDEIEKASDALWNLLLGILDKGMLTLGDNRKVDFSKAMIFMTSNLGAAEMSRILSPGMGFSVATRGQDGGTHNANAIVRSGLEAAKKKFTPEFMNRLDRIVVFKALSPDDLERILDIELKQVQHRIFNAPGVSPFVMQVGRTARAYLLRDGADIKYGARHLKRSIERSLVNPLSNLIASGQIQGGDLIEIEYSPELDRMTFYRRLENLSAAGILEAVTTDDESRKKPAVRTGPEPYDPLRNVIPMPVRGNEGRTSPGNGKKPSGGK